MGRLFFAIAFCLAILANARYASAQAEDAFGDTTAPMDDSLGSSDLDSSLDSSGLEDTGSESEEAAKAAFEAAMTEAKTLQDEGKWAEAVAKYQEILQNTRGRAPQPYLELAKCFAQLNNNEQALKILSQATLIQGAASIPGFVPTVLVEKAKLYVKVGNYPDAIDDLESALQYDPTNPEANYLTGKATLLQVLTTPSAGTDQAAEAAFQSALQALSRAIESKPDYGEAYLDRGRVLLRLRQVSYALEDHLKAVELLGDSSQAPADLGFTYKAQASFEAANPVPDGKKILDSYRAAIASMDRFLKTHSVAVRPKPWDNTDPLDIQPTTVLITKAETYIDLGDELGRDAKHYRLAIATCDQFLGIEQLSASERAQGHYTRGVAKRMLVDFAGAIDDFDKAIRLSKQTVRPFYPEANLRRGIILYYQGKLDLAMEDFREASLNLNNPLQSDPRAMCWIGLTYSKQNKLEMAVQSFTRAISGYPEYVSAYVNRGLTYMRIGRYQRALDDFDVALRLDGSNQKVKHYRERALRRVNQY
jgi:tetratricopeptide (TPR) repeat protein